MIFPFVKANVQNGTLGPLKKMFVGNSAGEYSKQR